VPAFFTAAVDFFAAAVREFFAGEFFAVRAVVDFFAALLAAVFFAAPAVRVAAPDVRAAPVVDFLVVVVRLRVAISGSA
jgi:hypothetical protein